MCRLCTDRPQQLGRELLPREEGHALRPDSGRVESQNVYLYDFVTPLTRCLRADATNSHVTGCWRKLDGTSTLTVTLFV
jgi:hypothetical protein